MGILRIPDGVDLQYATVKKLLLCKIPLHSIVSPAYLFRQNIDPFNLKHGLNSLEFVSEAYEDLTPSSQDDILLTFAFRHLSVLNAMAVQNFYNPDFFKRFNYMIDLKVALSTCAYFGNTRLKRVTNLNQVAKDLGFKGDLCNQLMRCEALYFIYNYLLQHDPKIMAFLSMPREKRLNLDQSSHYVYLEDNKLYVIRIMAKSSDGRIIKALKCNGSELALVTINLDYAPLIAPLGILTPERQKEHRFDVTKALKRLQEANLFELVSDGQEVDKVSVINDCDLPFYDQFFKQLDAQQLLVYDRLMQHDIRQEFNLSSIAHGNSKFNTLLMCYFNENFPGACFDAERRQYANYCNEHIRRRANNVIQECQILFENIKEQDTEGLALLKRISSYFQTNALYKVECAPFSSDMQGCHLEHNVIVVISVCAQLKTKFQAPS